LKSAKSESAFLNLNPQQGNPQSFLKSTNCCLRNWKLLRSTSYTCSQTMAYKLLKRRSKIWETRWSCHEVSWRFTRLFNLMSAVCRPLCQMRARHLYGMLSSGQ